MIDAYLLFRNTWLLFRFPRLWIKKWFWCKLYIRWEFPFNFLTVREVEFERILAINLLENWYKNPNKRILDNDILAIVNARAVSFDLIKHGYIREEVLELIFESIKDCGKHAWEILIEDLSRTSKRSKLGKQIIRKFLIHRYKRVRETGLLITEDGGFTTEQKIEYYEIGLVDNSKSVRIRSLDMVCRSNRRLRLCMFNILNERLTQETDAEVINAIKYTLAK
ncbi:hypothetical protein ACFSQD_11265 [Flavihumibacter stibioxidans]|uniref:Uncharacterized protein n=1 Tax=Flavihumibacter stibioxidans TaxID=1834163 RepID=A0ABR7MAZ3_9BACT|nr:hypothetical protein [Flavihumibacter stibioxidans]MBC6491796.1 hypothetical protein [Flavihumibacter stibioxidans]